MLNEVIDPKKKDKLDTKQEEPFRIRQKLNNEAYKLESLEGVEIPNVTNLKFYFS